MESLLLRQSFIARRIRQKRRVVRIEQIKQLFDDIISFLNNITFAKMKNEAMYILTAVCDELTTLNTYRLFDYSILRNHQIFNYIRQTCEMLLIKSNHSQSTPMIKQEEDCFSATSYLIAQLCLHQNEPVELFYGTIPNEIFQVTEKPNVRDKNIDLNSVKRDELMEKPNLKTARLRPNTLTARPIEETEPDITKVIRRKKFPSQFVSVCDETEVGYSIHQCNQIKVPSKKYQNIFLTESFFEQLVRAVDDLSQNEYPAYHVKYKVVDRFVRLCSKLNITEVLLNPIMKCLGSKYYHNAFETVELNQFQLNPKQLFFIHGCSQFIIQHGFLKKENIVKLLSQNLIEVTKPIFDKHFLATDVEIESNKGGDRRIAMHVLGSHIELLYHLSFTSAGRQHFLKSLLVGQLLLLLRQNALIRSTQHIEDLFNADINIIAYSLMLLCNLAYEKQIFSLLKQTDLKAICLKLNSAKDSMIRFASDELIQILSQEAIDDNHEPAKIKEAYITFLKTIIVEPKQEIKVRATKNITGREVISNFEVTTTYLEKLIEDIEDLSVTDHPPNAKKYKDVARRVRICSKQETNEVESLLDPIIACLNSEYYINVYIEIHLSETKLASAIRYTSRTIAAKHLFFMHECPEFVMRHDYKRQDEIASELCQKMLKNAGIIFEKHLPIAIGNEDDDEQKNVRIDALTYHIKLLNHFALSPSSRNDFLSTRVIDQIVLILKDETLIDTDGRIVDAKIAIVGQSLTLLYNLAFDSRILSIIRSKNMIEILSKLCLVQDKIIQFASRTLKTMCASSNFDDTLETSFLSKIYIEYMKKSIKEPRQPCQGVRLDGVLKSFEVIVENDSVQENMVDGKQGIPSIIQCAMVKSPDSTDPDMYKKIRQSALDIVWKLLSSFSGPKASGKLKSDDLFIDNLLTLSKGTAKKQKTISERIMWKLGDESTARLEQTKKEKQKETRKRRDSTITIADDRLITDDQWDDSVPFDLMISYSNNIAEKIICHKIFNRLSGKKFKVYIEKPGKHRLERMQQAVEKRKTILVCLSNQYRASNICMAEVEYASKGKCPIIPVLVEAKYKAKGWLNHLVGGGVTIDFTKKDFDDELLKLIDKMEQVKVSE